MYLTNYLYSENITMILFKRWVYGLVSIAIIYKLQDDIIADVSLILLSRTLRIVNMYIFHYRTRDSATELTSHK